MYNRRRHLRVCICVFRLLATRWVVICVKRLARLTVRNTFELQHESKINGTRKSHQLFKVAQNGLLLDLLALRCYSAVQCSATQCVKVKEVMKAWLLFTIHSFSLGREEEGEDEIRRFENIFEKISWSPGIFWLSVGCCKKRWKLFDRS